MANTKSARKRVRTTERNRLRNKDARTALRSQVKIFRAAITAGDLEKAGELLRSTHAAIDKTAKKGVIHDRTASRYKSRLAQAFRGLSLAQQG